MYLRGHRDPKSQIDSLEFLDVLLVSICKANSKTTADNQRESPQNLDVRKALQNYIKTVLLQNLLEHINLLKESSTLIPLQLQT